MRNFVFHNPTKIIFGQGQTPCIGPETAAYGRKALLLFGQNSARKHGILKQVTESLEAVGLEWVECGGIKSNPILGFVYAALDLWRREKPDVIVAVGGGSVIDTAKAIAAGACYPGDVWDFFCRKAVVTKAIPITTVLTLAASASEMNCGGVITNEKTQQKYNLMGSPLYPKVSILDPVNTLTVPRNYSMYGAVDAIIHLLEGYFNGGESRSPLQDRLVEGLIITIMEAAGRIFRRPRDYSARAELMWCATLGLNGLTTAGIGGAEFPMHMLEHALSAIYDIPHGAGLSIISPAWMKYASRKSSAKFAQFSRRVFSLDKSSPTATARAGIDAWEQWLTKIKVPVRLAEVDIPKSDIGKIAQNAYGLARVWGMKHYSVKTISRILNLAV